MKTLCVILLVTLTGCSNITWKEAVEKAQAEQRAQAARPKVIPEEDYLTCQHYSQGGGRCAKKVGSRITRCSYDKSGTYCTTSDY